MKRLLFGGLLALGLTVTAAPAWADGIFEYSNCRHLTWVITRKQRCFTCSSHINPLPCVSHYGVGYSGPAPWDALAAYGYPPPHPAPAGAAPAPAAPAPAAPQPSFKAPQPTPATNNSTGLQQAGYFYYGQTSNAGYGYNAGYYYGYYGYGAGYSYAQAPNYWY